MVVIMIAFWVMFLIGIIRIIRIVKRCPNKHLYVTDSSYGCPICILQERAKK